MKISYSWIKEFVRVNISPEELADALSMAGLSVAAFDVVGDDVVYDIEVTSNRPDWLSVRGIVHEIAAITNSKLTGSSVSKLASSRKRLVKKANRPTGQPDNKITIAIENPKDCALYFGRVICGVKVGPSPVWLKNKLETLGFRSINNVVDITNFCLLELGQPLHAFDFDKLDGLKVTVRRAKKGETLSLIDGTSGKLDENMLVIADATKPVAVAGVMGGADFEVREGTKNILLESACFDPVRVRRSARALGVSSEASYRFERGVDIVGAKETLERATELITALCQGEVCCTGQSGRPPSSKPKKIIFDLAKALDMLGADISVAQAKNIFLKLGFKVSSGSGTKKMLTVLVPSFRRDIKIQEDLAEELVRVWGYDKIPLTVPAIKPFYLDTPVAEALKKRFQDFLVNMGLKEIITYSLISDEDYNKTGLSGEASQAWVLENPISQDARLLRTTLVPSALKCVSFNASHNNRDLELFEVARIFTKGRQEAASSIVLCGQRRSSWLRETRPYTLFDLKGIIETLLDTFKITGFQTKRSDTIPFAAPGTAGEITVGRDVLAIFCQVSPAVKKAWGIKTKEDIFVAELSLERISKHAKLTKSFLPLSDFPGIVRDLSVLAEKHTSYASIASLIEAKAQGFVRHVALADIYQGAEIPADHVSLTISVEYGSRERTMTDEEVQRLHQGVLDGLKSELGLKIR